MWSFVIFLLIACSSDDVDRGTASTYPEVESTFEGSIDLHSLYNYANQDIPSYITKDNSGNNPITDAGATLGRVLFYDKELSTSRTVSCASCHKQELAFSDDEVVSTGVNGTTSRHSMRLINARFADEVQFFWDERASTLEHQTTQPIQDHAEMGFSGENGEPSLQDLMERLSSLGYYQELFTFVYGDDSITEERIQKALAQFIRSIQSFDSKYDEGRAQTTNDISDFPNFTDDENVGKALFIAPPTFNAMGERTGGGLGCAGCHRAPEFDIDPESGNNGVVFNAITGTNDLTNTRSPTLRDIFNSNGTLNSQLMHTGLFANISGVLENYDVISPNAEIDARLLPNGVPQRLELTLRERENIEDFLKTLTGSNVYTDEKWSNPFP